MTASSGIPACVRYDPTVDALYVRLVPEGVAITRTEDRGPDVLVDYYQQQCGDDLIEGIAGIEVLGVTWQMRHTPEPT
jgi:uncharacterized protein YuzE